MCDVFNVTFILEELTDSFLIYLHFVVPVAHDDNINDLSGISMEVTALISGLG
jgi:hypothetical protein